MTVRRGLGVLLLSLVLLAVGWVVTYGTALSEVGVPMLLAGAVGVLGGLVWVAVGLLRAPGRRA